jgi:hypothetical protein
MPFVDASLHCFYAFCSYYLFLSVYQISNNRTERTEADEGIKGFFIFSGPRGTQLKKLQNRDPVQLEGGFDGMQLKIEMSLLLILILSLFSLKLELLIL